MLHCFCIFKERTARMDLNALKEYACPRWSDFPDIELYMDQVISLLERMLAPFFSEEEKSITSTMIQNYVKQRIIPPPHNKRYTRAHLSLLFIVCVWKRFMQLSDISVLLEDLKKDRTEEELYAFFAAELTAAIRRVFTDDATMPKPLTDPADSAARAACVAFSTVMYAEIALQNAFPKSAKKAKSEKK